MSADPTAVGWRFDNSYTRLPGDLFAQATPTRVKRPRVAVLNYRLAGELGLNLDAIPTESAAALFAGQELPAGSEPIAQAYAGHQFGHLAMLGDGRAMLLGEHVTPDGRRFDVQFKGSGPTRFSRNGDGRAALGPMLREYVVSEAVAALGIPTTRSLAVVTTGEPVFRTSPRPGAVLTRVAASHIRVGTFEYATRRDPNTLRALADHSIARHYPELADAPDKYLAFFRAVCDRQAALVSKWMLVGFIHGVMNTDNVAVSGESIDYGPCAFMNAYRPDAVYSSIDHGGRYAYGNQPGITQWNLARFGETLLPLLDADLDKAVAAATVVLEDFPPRFERYWLYGMRAKLGLQTVEDGDAELANSLLGWMATSKADFTNTFRDLSADGPPFGDQYRTTEFQAWYARWQERLRRESRQPADVATAMREVNPAVIPRNHLVEEALAAAEDRDDLDPLHRLLAAVSAPFVVSAESAHYLLPPPDEAGYRTFCGT